MILLIVFGLLVGLLASLSGLGGGFLVVPYLLYIGKNAQTAVGTSFVVVLLIALSSLAGHWRMGGVDYKTGLMIAAGAVAGAQLGPILLQSIPEYMFKRGFALLMIGLGAWMFLKVKTPA